MDPLPLPSLPARFVPGQRVRTRAARATGHTRLPHFLSERQGIIERVQGFYPLADDRAEGRAAAPQAIYCVVFEARELWGDGASGFRVSADLWDAYLEEAP
ncbi:SH3-like domain-containing protein [Pendulispora albinea]|uniref:SH3-like domain-containing protein n=1 Tax=Pendulispora albinea TaxID=2741071 RepID=UPI00374E1BC0